MYYYGNLLYGAIFGSPENYECNVKRIVSRSAFVSQIYYDKINSFSGRNGGCGESLRAGILTLAGKNRVTSSSDLTLIGQTAKQVEEDNNYAKCKLF